MLTAAAACSGLLLWARRAGGQWRLPGTAAARRSAANASSVMLSADVGG